MNALKVVVAHSMETMKVWILVQTLKVVMSALAMLLQGTHYQTAVELVAYASQLNRKCMVS